MKQHVKNKAAQQKLELIAKSTERRTMPRPAVFADKTKYNRAAQKQMVRNYDTY